MIKQIRGLTMINRGMKYYLTSSEYENLKGPFECEIISNTFLHNRQVLLVSIEPWMAGIDYGLGYISIKKLFLLAKYKDKELHLLNKFPIDVHVIIPDNTDNPIESKMNWSQMKNIGWAELNIQLSQSLNIIL